MTARFFIDSNIVIYSESADGEKTAKALALVEGSPVISTQVINESISVLVRKYAFSLTEAYEVAESVMSLCEVAPVDVAVVSAAMRLGKSHSLSHWDALIVAAALLAGCGTLYTEDMQHEQVLDGRLKVINPFL